MTATRIITPAVAATAAVCLAGCGLTDPYTPPRRTTTTAPSTTAAATTTTTLSRDPAPERGGTIPAPDQRAQRRPALGAGQPSARAAVELYARLYINWRAGTLATIQRHLARIAIGPARQAAAQQAATATTNTTLRADHVANRGQVISVQRGQTAERGRWVIVTREQTTGNGPYRGLPWQLHVTLATATDTRHGWVISQWSPQT